MVLLMADDFDDANDDDDDIDVNDNIAKNKYY